MRGQGFNRPPRVRPRWPSEQIELPAPPTPPRQERVERLPMLMPIVGAGLISAVVLGSGGSWLFAVPAGAMATLGVAVALRGEHTAARRIAVEHAARLELFEDQLDAQRARLHRLHEHERAARLHLAPDPDELLAIAGARGPDSSPEPRLWERRPRDDDFLSLRLGCGDLPAASQALVRPPAPDAPVDRRLHRIAAEYATQRQVPIVVPLGQLGSLGVAGPRQLALPLLHALLWQAAVLHAPADLRIAALYPADASGDWEWLRWLPHSVPLGNEPAHSLRMCAGEPVAAARLLSDLLDQLGRRREQMAQRASGAPMPLPWLLLVVDGVELARAHPAIGELLRHGAALGIATLLLVPSWPQIPESCAAMLDVGERGARWTPAGEPWPREQFSPDRAELAKSDRLARRLAAVRLHENGASQDIPRSVRLFDLLGIGAESELAPPHFWATPPDGAWRADVPIGALAEGKPICLDLDENRHGPHGIIAGATGAGKSVLLQSVIAALAVTHAPDRLQLLLIDFKGGAALSMFGELPHTAGLVTDLEGRLAERAMTAIKSELRRRKTLLKVTAATTGSKVENIADYRALASSHGLAALPNLLIVVDEFDEMARSYQEFVAELVRVVKQGRSLGVHLLVATQQPARAVTDEIRSQLKFFIALRLGSSDDSREMILKPDAAFLPTDIPGRAYFRVGGDLRLFQVAQVTGTYHPGGLAVTAPRVSFVKAGREQPIVLDTSDVGVAAPRETDLDVLVRALRRAAPAAALPQIWQPPLPARITLGALPDPGEVAAVLAAGAQVAGNIWMRVPIGQLDIPQESRQEPFVLDLAAAHLALVGAPGSGKTMLLRTLVLGLALRHSPRALWCYLIDAGGQGLSPLAGLPHVAAIIQVRERERVRRLVRMLDAAIRDRQDRLRAADAADLPTYRASGGNDLPALLVVIDKLAVLREEFRDERSDSSIIDDLVRLARVGRPYGVHLVISADRPSDLSYRLLSLLDTRIALRQAELVDYTDLLGTRVRAPIPACLPGRALWPHADHGPLELQLALPSIERPAADDMGSAPGEAARAFDSELMADLREQVATIAAAWSAQIGAVSPMSVELLPDQLRLADLPAPNHSNPNAGLCVAIGRESLALGVAELRLDTETPHALVIGGRRSGKTTLLATTLRSLVAVYGPEELELLILDSPRGGLASLRELPQTAGYACGEQGASELIARIVNLRAESLLGPQRVIVIDDYVLCRERMREQLTQSYDPAPNLFGALCELAQLGGQRGTHLLVATNIAYPDDALLRALDGGRNGILLWPGRYESGTRLLGVGLPLADQRDAEQPSGRALLVREDSQALVQIARS